MQISRLVSDRFAVLVSFVEIGLGLLLYGYPETFQVEPRLVEQAQLLSALFLVGGMATVTMIRHPIPQRLLPLQCLPPAAPWLGAAVLAWGTPLAIFSLLWGVLSLLLLAWQPGGGPTGLRRERLDLVDLLIGGLHLLVALLVFAIPADTDDALLRLLQHWAIPTFVLFLVGGAALFSKHRWCTGSPLMAILGRFLSVLPSVLLSVAGVLAGAWDIVYFTGTLALTLLLPPELPGRPEPASPADLVPVVEKRVEFGSWLLTAVAIVPALLVDSSGQQYMRPLGAVVLLITLYNVVIHWLLPRLGTPKWRLRLHLVAFTVAAAVMVAFMGSSPVAQAATLMLIIPPMLAAQAFGFRVSLIYLALGAVAVCLAEGCFGVLPLATGVDASRFVIRELIYLVAGLMVNRSAAQMSRLLRDLHEVELELRAANEDLAAQSEELAAQQEELSSQNEALYESAAALRQLADFDPLTGLANRRSFQDLLDSELQRSAGEGGQGAIVFLDLDRFKYINDSLGHTAGDHLLQRVGTALLRAVGSHGTVARLGGDEFAVLLPGADEALAGAVVEGVLGSLHEVQMVVNDEEIPIRASAGIALYPSDSDTSEGLLQAADIAMYAAKEAGRDGFSLFRQCDARFVNGDPRVHWQREVQAALAEDRLRLHFQPMVESETGRTVSYEVLLRLESQDGELYYPDSFLPTLEQLPPLMQAVDRWVVRRSFQWMAESSQSGNPLSLQINLSAHSVTDPAMLPLIELLLTQTRVEPGRVIFEITETVAPPDPAACKRFAQRLRDLGCGVATDDFGHGFASLARLRNLPIRQLKIAGQLVQGLGGRPQDLPIIRAIVEMAREMDIQTVAEWVEDPDTFALLKKLEVDLVQGYLFGRPGESPEPARTISEENE